MINFNAFTEDEKARYDEYLSMAQKVREAPGMAESRNTNVGGPADPMALLPKSTAPNAYAEKINAIFNSK